MNAITNRSLEKVAEQIRQLGNLDYVTGIAEQLFIQAIKSASANDPIVRDKFCYQYFYIIIPALRQVFAKSTEFDMDLHAERVDLTLTEMFELYFKSEVLRDCLSDEYRSDIIELLKAFTRIVELMDEQKKYTC